MSTDTHDGEVTTPEWLKVALVIYGYACVVLVARKAAVWLASVFVPA
jgi:hypothetical protein